MKSYEELSNPAHYIIGRTYYKCAMCGEDIYMSNDTKEGRDYYICLRCKVVKMYYE